MLFPVAGSIDIAFANQATADIGGAQQAARSEELGKQSIARTDNPVRQARTTECACGPYKGNKKPAKPHGLRVFCGVLVGGTGIEPVTPAV